MDSTATDIDIIKHQYTGQAGQHQVLIQQAQLLERYINMVGHGASRGYQYGQPAS
jgi:hypothetical protein